MFMEEIFKCDNGLLIPFDKLKNKNNIHMISNGSPNMETVLNSCIKYEIPFIACSVENDGYSYIKFISSNTLYKAVLIYVQIIAYNKTGHSTHARFLIITIKIILKLFQLIRKVPSFL